MRYTQVQTPRGVRDWLPPEAAKRRAIETVVCRQFQGWGYDEIITPTFEFFDALALGDGPELAGDMYKFFDREGHMLALRPEMTTPIARVAATRLAEDAGPLRLYYLAPVFRYDEPQTGRQREFHQAGIELIGAEGAEADAETVAMAVHTFRRLGVDQFCVDIGHIDYYRGMVNEIGVGADAVADVRRALIRRDYVGLESIISELPLNDGKKRALLALPELRGGLEVLDRAERLVANARSLRAVAELRSVYHNLESYGVQDAVSVDLGMVKNIDYYTGMVLEGYSRNLGFTLCTGGRYDNLITHFGEGRPATGFALGVERVMLTLERQGWDVPGSQQTYVVATASPEARTVALEAVNRLRDAGHRAVFDFDGRLSIVGKEDQKPDGFSILLVAQDNTATVENGDDQPQSVTLDRWLASMEKGGV